MSSYFRPIVEWGESLRPADAVPVAGGRGWFREAIRLERGVAPERVDIASVPSEIRDRISAARPGMAGLEFSSPCLMGILNVTPDSFSDGGRFNAPEAALARARELEAKGAAIVDIGGESTRPGAEFVPVDEECARTIPVISAIREGSNVPISIDTRKASVGRAALEAGANLVNDVSALTFEPELGEVASAVGAPVCLMHAQGDPTTMQDDPRYGDVLLDVYDFLEDRIATAERAGIPRSMIMVDPGIGFGKTLHHNLALLRGLSLFHALGCPILLGASRKRFIGTITGVEDASQRAPGSVAVAVMALDEGVQVIRAHDIEASRQALLMWRAMRDEEASG